MAFTISDVINKAVEVGSLDSNDANLMTKVSTTAEMVVEKASIYIGYDSTTVDALLNVLAEITITQITYIENLRNGMQGATKRITRGDYTVEYDTNPSQVDVFHSYEWILKKYKKLRTL